jgi:hypothetical protein
MASLLTHAQLKRFFAVPVPRHQNTKFDARRAYKQPRS